MDLKVDEHTTIVFDLDDTLYKEMDFLRSAYMEIAKSIDQEDWRSVFGFMFSLYRKRENVFAILSKKYNLNSQDLINLYRTHKPILTLANGARELLHSLKSKKANLAILTDGRSLTQRHKIEALGLGQFVDQYFISEELGTEKPHENNYRMIEEHFGSRDYFYIADNLKKDFITPKARKWKTIGLIDNGLNIHTDHTFFDQQDYLPDHFILTLEELKVK